MNERYEDLVRHIQNLRILERRLHTGINSTLEQLKHTWRVRRRVEQTIHTLSAELARRRATADV